MLAELTDSELVSDTLVAPSDAGPEWGTTAAELLDLARALRGAPASYVLVLRLRADRGLELAGVESALCSQ